jgi:Family of unknown function (DUF5856)
MASQYVGMLMSSRNQAHAFHLTTTSFAEHKALQAYYEGIIPLADAWAEAYMGLYGRMKTPVFNKTYLTDPTKAKQYFKTLLSRVQKLKLPKDTYLTNIKDEITALIRSTLYMLTLR